LDITDGDAVSQTIAAEKPDIIINAAAYTAVDRAEEQKEMAFRINRDGAKHLAQAARANGARLLYISTDFVFDGNRGTPYKPLDEACPISVYGSSKYQGECAILDTLADRAIILRSAWVYASHGHNFVKSMLRLMGDRDSIDVVADQTGTPTWARGLAETIWRLSRTSGKGGIYHWTDAGIASWYDFAVAIAEEGRNLSLLKQNIKVNPISTQAYPTLARRPAYSVLDKEETWSLLGRKSLHWRIALRSMMKELKIDDDT